jgi:hypothetical protein
MTCYLNDLVHQDQAKVPCCHCQDCWKLQELTTPG